MAGRPYDRAVWKRLRKRILAANPLCVYCKREGVNEKATDVDHIVPLSMGGRRFDPANLQPLCSRCNSIKAVGERSGRAKEPPRTDERGYPNPDWQAWAEARRKS